MVMVACTEKDPAPDTQVTPDPDPDPTPDPDPDPDPDPTPDPEPDPNDGTVIETPYIQGNYYTPEQLNIETHNFFFALSTVEWDGSLEGLAPNSKYFYFDIYADSVADNYSIPNGTYELDIYDSTAAGTAGAYYTYGFETTDSLEPAYWYIYTDGVVTVTDNKIVAELTLDTGEKIIVTYNGSLALIPILDEPADIVLDATNYTYYAERNSGYYTADSDNWIVTIFEDDVAMSGEYIYLDLISDPANDTCAGVYSCLEDDNDYLMKYVPGYITEDYYLAGCWYTIIQDGALTEVYTPFYDGSISISVDDSGVATFTFDCIDNGGNAITGTIKANAGALAESMAIERSKSTMRVNSLKSMVIR